MEKEQLIEIANTIMPFGKYKGRRLIDLPEEYLLMMVQQNESKERVVCDYIAGMSDSYAIDRFEQLFVPKAWKVY